MKSLFYVYKELLGLSNLKLKTFIRSDIFDRITADGGFTSLSHIHARTSAPIKWDDTRIEEFFSNRFKKQFLNCSNEDIVQFVVGKQIDVGRKQPPSMRWIINHLRDGQDNCTPRDVLGLLGNARQYTLTELETKNARSSYETLFTKSAVKQAWEETSKDKLTTQIYAENPELKTTIETFRGKKARYSHQKLEELLGESYLALCDQLHYVGILTKTGENMMIPFLYRPALNVRQGTA